MKLGGAPFASLLTACVLTALACAPAHAQPSRADPIGALLEAAPEMEEPDMASEPVRPPEPEPTVAPVYGAPPPAPPRPQLSHPTHIDEVGRSPDAPPSVRDLAYESRIRSSIASAQRYQGPLDGGWTLSVGGRDLFALQLVDRGRGQVEGAWRDLRRLGAVGASGFVEQIESQGPDLILRFTTQATGAVEIALHAAGSDLWTGDVLENGERRSANLRRKGG